MWIETTRDGLRRLFNADVLPPDEERTQDIDDYWLEFSSTNRAQVPDEVGEAYVAHYDDISESTNT